MLGLQLGKVSTVNTATRESFNVQLMDRGHAHFPGKTKWCASICYIQNLTLGGATVL